MQNSYRIGLAAEDVASRYLQQQNLQLLHKNFHSRFGEIDLVMQDKDTVVFVEVRQRSNGLDHALASISQSKQRKLIKAAEYYIVKIGHDIDCRFDVIAMDKQYNIEWLKNIIFM